jgi:hypothetical protein
MYSAADGKFKTELPAAIQGTDPQPWNIFNIHRGYLHMMHATIIPAADIDPEFVDHHYGRFLRVYENKEEAEKVFNQFYSRCACVHWHNRWDTLIIDTMPIGISMKKMGLWEAYVDRICAYSLDCCLAYQI